MKRLVYFLLLVILVATVNAVQAQQSAVSDDFRHHVIVILDRSGSMTAGRSMGDIQNLITTDLHDICFVEDNVVSGRKLLDESQGDYLSIISFGLDADKDFDKFIQLREHGINYGFDYAQDFDDQTFQTLWNTIRNRYHGPRDFYSKWELSIISAALPLGVYTLRKKEPLVNRTFILMITDDEYNGAGNPADEMAQGGISLSDNSDVLDHFAEVDADYRWRKLSLEPSRGRIKLKIFELEARANNFTIGAALDYDREVTFFRVPDGYETRYQLTLKPNPAYQIEKLEATLLDGTTEMAQETFLKLHRDTTLSFFVDRSYHEDSLKIRMRSWVHAMDDAYGAHVLHPKGDAFQGGDGLNQTVNAVFDDPGQIWFFLPMWDWLYDLTALVGVREKLTARIVWHVIFGFIGFLAFMLFLRRAITFRKADAAVIE